MSNLFEISKDQLNEWLAQSDKILKDFYKQEKVRIISSPQYPDLLREIELKMNGIEQIPDLNKKLYIESRDTGNRQLFENPYDKRRVNLSLLAFMVISGKNEYLPLVEKYLSEICDEESWVIPAHDGRLIDIYAADTVLTLSETVAILRDKLSSEIIERVFQEVRQKIFDPYQDRLKDHIWYDLGDNWTSVCNSCIGSAYLLMEQDMEKQVNAVSTVLMGLKTYIDNGFKADGGTDEGVLYWHYGMGKFTIFAEHLFNSTDGQINLFKEPKLKKISKFPVHMYLGNKIFISFSDAYEHGTTFQPGFIQKIASRTETPGLLGLISDQMSNDSSELPNLVRYCTWWDGKKNSEPKVESILLPDLGIAKSVSTKLGYPVIVSTKGGNNDENHNHNDLGSWILTVDGENFFTDPGPGKYTGDYFSEKRYQNIFTNSYGHSVPVIDDKLQAQGKEYSGKIEEYFVTDEMYVLMNLTKAYPVKELKNYTREIRLDEENRSVILTDNFMFSDGVHSIQEAFVTYKSVREINTRLLILEGEKHSIEVSIDRGEFKVESLDRDSLENEKQQVLKRITVDLDLETHGRFILECKITLNRK